MNREQIIIHPIGIIHTPHTDIKNMPIQPFAAKGVKAYVEIYQEYAGGLADLEDFSHITLLYHFHKIKGYELKVKPFMDEYEHGIFATRSPKRPNAIGFSTIKIVSIEHNLIHFEGADMLNETPLIDIKPFFEYFDNRFSTSSGWLTEGKIENNNLCSDERFKE